LALFGNFVSILEKRLVLARFNNLTKLVEESSLAAYDNCGQIE